jgi:L-ribulose-5-phosphate 3-epimerase
MSISTVSSQQSSPVDALAAGAAQAGFDAIELAILDDGPLTYGTPEAECRRFAECIKQAGLEISALATGGRPASELFSSLPAVQRAASLQIIAAMTRARWLGTDAIILPMRPGMGRTLTGPNPDFETTFSLALDAMLTLRAEAGYRAIHLVCGNDWNRFLASPIEVRRFIDQINSPWVGAALDITDTLAGGMTRDWIAFLGHRVSRLYIGDGVPAAGQTGGAAAGNAVDRQAVIEALRRIRYEGPVTYCGRADPREARARFDAILSMPDRTIG